MLNKIKYAKSWLHISVFNFFLLAVLGVIMRFNIISTTVLLIQGNVKESHSHFAFYGWVTSAIYLLVGNYLSVVLKKEVRPFQWILTLNLIGSFGMLVTFLYGGYYWLSIAFSAVCLFTGFLYFFVLLQYRRIVNSWAFRWILAGAFFAVVSALGIFSIAFFSSRKDEFLVFYRASNYFYLHFQYNGFFLFSCIGLLLNYVKQKGVFIDKRYLKYGYYSLLISCFFGVGLSFLWAVESSLFATFCQVIGGVQLIGFFVLVKSLFQAVSKTVANHSTVLKTLFALFSFAYLIKFVLQFLSAFQVFGQAAFLNHDVIIVYLHLVLLLGISLNLVYLIAKEFNLDSDKKLAFAMFCVAISVLLYVLLLGVKALCSVMGFSPAYSHLLLFFSSVLIALSLLAFFVQLVIRKISRR